MDAAMHAQLTDFSRNHAGSDIVLITGDGDLLPGVMAAKDHGVAIHRWAVQAADGEYNQSADLVVEADERHLLDRACLTQVIKAAEPPTAAEENRCAGRCPRRRPAPRARSAPARGPPQHFQRDGRPASSRSAGNRHRWRPHWPPPSEWASSPARRRGAHSVRTCLVVR